MSAPSRLLALGIVLRPGDDPQRHRHVAHLAGRLGYGTVWLPVAASSHLADSPADAPAASPPDHEALALLADAAAPARLGVVLTGAAAGHARWVRAVLGPTADVLLAAEVAEGDRDVLVEALGGPAAWRGRAHVRAFDATAAGCLLAVADRDQLLAAVRAARDARRQAGRTAADFTLTAELTVSIGRTMNEAVARALRDPAFAGERHPRFGGLYGTLEEAQAQALALARAGLDAVAATLADERDVADLLAQLRAVAVGPTAVLHARGK
jgi:hypothetical protein